MGKEKDISYQNKLIKEFCDEIALFLIEKNTSYNGSVFMDNRFADITAEQGIKIRIGDKINRIMSGKNYKDENDYKDLLGYLILLEVNKKLKNIEE